jgi:hypothetical protein
MRSEDVTPTDQIPLPFLHPPARGGQERSLRMGRTSAGSPREMKGSEENECMLRYPLITGFREELGTYIT